MMQPPSNLNQLKIQAFDLYYTLTRTQNRLDEVLRLLERQDAADATATQHREARNQELSRHNAELKQRDEAILLLRTELAEAKMSKNHRPKKKTSSG